MITVKNISKTFKLYKTPSDRLKEILLRRSYHKNFQAVKNISFEVQEGETLGIIGENGAGKSTILKLLTGILIPDTGSVYITGKITGLLELGTGFNAEFSGIDNIIHNAAYLGLSRQEINKKIDTIIKFTELGEFIHEPIKTYSSGMVMRLAFSVAIHADPKAFVVDEALSVGDAYFQQKCMKKIKEFKNNGGSIVFVSHDMNAVKILCDKAILLDHGTVFKYGNPEAIINSYNFLITKKSRENQISYKNGQASSGFGNHKIMIDAVEIRDKDNHPAKIFISGHPAKIIIRMTGHEDITNFTVGITIRDKFGQDMYGTNSYYLEKPISIKKNQTISVAYAFKKFNLGAGNYSISPAIHTGPTHIEECMHWMDGCAVFEVIVEDGSFLGLVRLMPELDITAH